MWEHPATRKQPSAPRGPGARVRRAGIGIPRLRPVGRRKNGGTRGDRRGRRLRLATSAHPGTWKVSAFSSNRRAPRESALDPIRFLSNRSSGRMGYAVAEAARDRGARVTLLSGTRRACTPPGGSTVRLLRDRCRPRQNPARRGVPRVRRPGDDRRGRRLHSGGEPGVRLHRSDGERSVLLAPGKDLLAGLTDRSLPRTDHRCVRRRNGGPRGPGPPEDGREGRGPRRGQRRRPARHRLRRRPTTRSSSSTADGTARSPSPCAASAKWRSASGTPSWRPAALSPEVSRRAPSTCPTPSRSNAGTGRSRAGRAPPPTTPPRGRPARTGAALCGRRPRAWRIRQPTQRRLYRCRTSRMSQRRETRAISASTAVAARPDRGGRGSGSRTRRRASGPAAESRRRCTEESETSCRVFGTLRGASRTRRRRPTPRSSARTAGARAVRCRREDRGRTRTGAPRRSASSSARPIASRSRRFRRRPRARLVPPGVVGFRRRRRPGTAPSRARMSRRSRRAIL